LVGGGLTISNATAAAATGTTNEITIHRTS
jgi:hypothetical protein